jgi:hypothetical protein
METMAAWFASSTAAGTAATAGTAASAAFGLRDGLALISGGLQIAGGFQQAAALRSQAEMEKFNARSEEIAGMQAANATRQRLLETLAAQNAAFAASGVTLDGTPQDVMVQTQSDGDRELSIVRSQSDMNAGARRMQAGIYGQQATGAIVQGFGRAAGTLFDYVDRRDRIGTVPTRAPRPGGTGPGGPR